MNLLCLQCLAHRIDPMLLVVEPFLVRSIYLWGVTTLNSPMQDSPWMKATLRMSDIFNTTVWLEHSRNSCYSPLIYFLGAVFESGSKEGYFVWDGSLLKQLERSLAPFFQLQGFEVVHKVCLNFKTSLRGTLGLWRYKQNIYGDLEPTKTTLVCQKWMGVGNNNYCQQVYSECSRLLLQEGNHRRPSGQ